ncbi:MAG TPA: hypothetical protein DCM86_11970, partial [Verrucomicrobiales bacterium]|nr:hypothetical protein [Verrucomicrobiales bacterium]
MADPGMKKTNTVASGSVPLTAGQPAGGTNEIHGLKPPVDIPYGWLPILLGVAGGLLAAFLTYRWLRGRKKPEPP